MWIVLMFLLPLRVLFMFALSVNDNYVYLRVLGRVLRKMLGAIFDIGTP
jgi:hypothetical protein